MLINVKDSAGITRTICAQSQDAPADRSGTILAAGSSQPLMVANAARAGWFVQNTGQNTTLRVNDFGGSANADNAVILLYGQIFPPPGYPVTVGALNITGDVTGSTYSAREW